MASRIRGEILSQRHLFAEQQKHLRLSTALSPRFFSAGYQDPGQELQFVQEDNLLLSFKRGNNDKWLYNDILRFNYKREFGDHVSYELGLKYWRQEPAGTIAMSRTWIHCSRSPPAKLPWNSAGRRMNNSISQALPRAHRQ